MFDKSLRKSVQPFLDGSEQLLGEAPIGDVEGIDIEPAGLAKAVTLRVRGTEIGIETARGQPAEDLPRALELARAS